MGIKERHVRDRETVRRAILDAARELFVAEGFQNVSIRKIAERIEYSPAAIYGYFPSKDDIFFALAEEGFRLLCDLGAPARLPDEPASVEHIRERFTRLYEFSRDHPQYFALMFVDRSVPRISREYERFAFAREKKENIVKEIAACVDAGLLPRTLDPAVAMRTLMVGVIGVAVLRLSERLQPGENADSLAADMLDLTIAGLQSGVTLRSTPAEGECRLEEAETHVEQLALEESR
jgi:AcrR family transcriptional regulator